MEAKAGETLARWLLSSQVNRKQAYRLRDGGRMRPSHPGERQVYETLITPLEKVGQLGSADQV